MGVVKQEKKIGGTKAACKAFKQQVFIESRHLLSGLPTKTGRKQIDAIVDKNPAAFEKLFARVGEAQTKAYVSIMVSNGVFASKKSIKSFLKGFEASLDDKEASTPIEAGVIVNQNTDNTSNPPAQKSKPVQNELQTSNHSAATALVETSSPDFISLESESRHTTFPPFQLQLPVKSGEVNCDRRISKQSGGNYITRYFHPQALIASSDQPRLPYPVQHIALTTTQKLLEDCCFAFAEKWMPQIVSSKQLTCSEAIEMSQWPDFWKRGSQVIPAGIVIAETNKTIYELLQVARNMRNIAVHRSPIPAIDVAQFVSSAMRIAKAFQDSQRLAQLECMRQVIQSEVSSKITNFQSGMSKKMDILTEKNALKGDIERLRADRKDLEAMLAKLNSRYKELSQEEVTHAKGMSQYPWDGNDATRIIGAIQKIIHNPPVPEESTAPSVVTDPVLQNDELATEVTEMLMDVLHRDEPHPPDLNMTETN